MDKFIQCVVLILVVLMVGSNSNAEISLEKRKLFSNQVEILIPQNLKATIPDHQKSKYLSQRRPTAIYSNSLTSVNLAFDLLEKPASRKKISEYTEAMSTTFKNMYPSAEWLGNEVLVKNGRNIGYLELITPSIDTEVYNLIFFTEIKDKLFVSTFNCPKKLMAEWKPIAWEIMNSLLTSGVSPKT